MMIEPASIDHHLYSTLPYSLKTENMMIHLHSRDSIGNNRGSFVILKTKKKKLELKFKSVIDE